jgi:hypothetical protein
MRWEDWRRNRTARLYTTHVDFILSDATSLTGLSHKVSMRVLKLAVGDTDSQFGQFLILSSGADQGFARLGVWGISFFVFCLLSEVFHRCACLASEPRYIRGRPRKYEHLLESRLSCRVITQVGTLVLLLDASLSVEGLGSQLDRFWNAQCSIGRFS